MESTQKAVKVPSKNGTMTFPGWEGQDGGGKCVTDRQLIIQAGTGHPAPRELINKILGSVVQSSPLVWELQAPLETPFGPGARVSENPVVLD